MFNSEGTYEPDYNIYRKRFHRLFSKKKLVKSDSWIQIHELSVWKVLPYTKLSCVQSFCNTRPWPAAPSSFSIPLFVFLNAMISWDGTTTGKIRKDQLIVYMTVYIWCSVEFSDFISSCPFSNNPQN